MKSLPVTDTDLLKVYLDHKFPNSTVVVVHSNDDIVAEIPKILEKLNVETPDFCDLVECEILIIPFGDDEDGAMELCENIPDSSPYTTVWHHGEITCENT